MKSKKSFVFVIVAEEEYPYYSKINEIYLKITNLIANVKKCKTVNECEEFVRSTPYQYIILLLVPNLVKKIFDQNIYELRHVQLIFVFNPNSTSYSCSFDELKKLSYKLQDACPTSDDLYQRLYKWIRDFAHESDGILSCLSISPSDAMTTNIVNGVADFAEYWYLLYIDFLLDLPIKDPHSERQRFCEQYRIHFSQNEKELQFIHEFEVNYQSKNAVLYYSEDTFLYKLVNKASRNQTIDAIMNFRFFFIDLHTQIETKYRTTFTTTYDTGHSDIVYRGQDMSYDELKQLKKKHCDGTLITTNSYLSTSMNRAAARIFTGSFEEHAETVSVLFEITVPINSSEKSPRKPFAFIADISKFNQEEEVLFSIGSFFKITNISYNQLELLYIVQMIYVNDNDSTLEVTKDYHALRSCPLEIMMIKVGSLLADHPQKGISVAKDFYKMIEKEKFSELLTAACSTGLGMLAFREENFESTINLQQSALNQYEQLKEFENNSDSLKYLQIMSYNCIGNVHRFKKDYRQALEYFSKAQQIDYKIPIDKYAMYSVYQNITAVNIASICKLTNNVDIAWNTYKNMLAYEMGSSILFRGHTYLTIAEAGLREAQTMHDINEQERCLFTTKAFLDLSLTDLHSDYRRSIISGVLNLGFGYANNAQTYTIAIDYFKEIVRISERYISKNTTDRLNVLQCLNNISQLYVKTRNYTDAFNYAVKALEICKEDDFLDIARCFKSMSHIYRQRLIDEQNNLVSEDINRLIVFINNEKESYSTIKFNREEFTFGQFRTKEMNLDLLEDTDRKHQLGYCLLKKAALLQMQGYKDQLEAEKDDNNLLRKRAYHHSSEACQLIYEVQKLLNDVPLVQKICINNLAYIEGNFDSIIKYYLQDLKLAQQNATDSCIGEDAFCYIAHLYNRKSNIDEEQQWYKRGVEYFHDHGHICQHTMMCFYKLAHFYEKHGNFNKTIDVYESLVVYLLKYKKPSFLCISIEPIVTEFVRYFKEKNETKCCIDILQQFIQLIQIEPADDHFIIDEQFQKIIAKCKNETILIAQAYLTYIEIILRHKPLLSDSYICVITATFSRCISIHKMHKNYQIIIETCKNFVELLINIKTDRVSIQKAFKNMSLDLESVSLFDTALEIYEYLSGFILDCHNKDDFVMAGGIITRCKFLQQKNVNISNSMEQMLVKLMDFYHDSIEPQFVVIDYLKTKQVKYEHQSSTDVYMNLLEFCFQHRSERYNMYMKTNIENLLDRPKELIAFITTNRINYKELICAIHDGYLTEIETQYISVYLPRNFQDAALSWLRLSMDRNYVYWNQILYHLFEWYSKDDECTALCYSRLGDANSAARVFDKEFYSEVAIKFNSNACRRFLQYVYPVVSTEEQIQFQQRFHNHFFI